MTVFLTFKDPTFRVFTLKISTFESLYACMHQFEHFAELVIMKTRQAEQLCMFNVYPLCFNSIQNSGAKQKNRKKSNCSSNLHFTQ